jgi:hypothetical protein
MDKFAILLILCFWFISCEQSAQADEPQTIDQAIQKVRSITNSDHSQQTYLRAEEAPAEPAIRIATRRNAIGRLHAPATEAQS